MDMKCARVGAAVMLLKDNKILLGKRHDDPEKADSLLHGEGTWTLPGGKVDFGQTVEQSARREVEEETSLKVGKMKVISIGDEILPEVHFVTIGFVCEDFAGEEKVMEPDEITKWRWFSFNELPEMIFPPSAKMIQHYLDDEIYTFE